MAGRRRSGIRLALILCTALHATVAEAQWTDPRLIAGQVGFSVAVSFLGKLIRARRAPLQALREALLEGSASGLVAHAGYCLAGQKPQLALVGKTLAQKSMLMSRRSIEGQPVFDGSFLSHWQLTHSFLHFRLEGKPRLEVDVLNLAVAGYFLSSDGYRLDGGRSLYSGSLVFRNERAPAGVRGFSAPGVIWISSARYEDRAVFGHELIHSLQMERGSAISDLHYKAFRFNFLAFSSGVPAVLGGWPEHDRRLHEQEADLYARRE